MPTPVKPIEQKRRAGNPGKRPLPAPVLELRPVDFSSLETPAHLEAPGKKIWYKAWHSGLSWLSPDSDMAIVLAACELADMKERARLRYNATGDSKDAGAVQKLNAEYLKCLSLMGFSPSDRSRLGLAEVKRQTKLEQLRATR